MITIAKNNKDTKPPKTAINWFPGHMMKAERRIKEVLPLIDAVVEVTDARIPASSRNPDLARIIGAKPRIVLLNKCDMADDRRTAAWISHYRRQGVSAVAVDSKTGKGLSVFRETVKTAMSDKLAQYREKGMIGKPIRVMAVGIPNVGKSSLINRLSSGGRAKVENRPGVTRGNQWFTVDRQLELLDTPGVLWPKFEDETVGLHLAFVGSIKDTVVEPELLAIRLLEILARDYPDRLSARYGALLETADSYELLCAIGKKRGMLIRGGETDTERAANMLLEEFRSCKIGKLTLEGVEQDAGSGI